MGGLVSKITDDVLGFDPNGGGIYGVANDVLGSTIADDILGLDPSGGGIVPVINTGANIAGNYLLGQAIGGVVGDVFGDGGVSAAADADIAGGMIPEYGTNAAYDSAMASAMTPEAMAAIEAGIAGPVGPMTQAELGQSFEDYMKAAGYTADTMGPLTAEQLGSSFQDYMAKSGYTPALDSLFSVPQPIQDALFKQLAGLFAGGLAASAAGQNTPTYTPPPAYKPQDTMPSYSPEYFNQVQDYYTGYMPNMPRDVATPLQDWYNTGYTGEDSVTKKLFGV